MSQCACPVIGFTGHAQSPFVVFCHQVSPNVLILAVTLKTTMMKRGEANQQETLKLLSYQTSNTALVGLVLGACCCVKMDLFDVLKRTYMLFSVVLNSKFPLWGVE